MSEQPSLRRSSFQDEVIRLAELTVNTNQIEGYEFINCRVIGPAVLALVGGVEIGHCVFDAPGLDAIFWEVPEERGPVVGVVGVMNCRFVNCRFEWIGIAGPPEARAQLEEGFSFGQ